MSMEKQGVVNEENTPPTPEVKKKKCCGGSCHPSPQELADHMLKRAADKACEELQKQGE